MGKKKNKKRIKKILKIMKIVTNFLLAIGALIASISELVKILK